MGFSKKIVLCYYVLTLRESTPYFPIPCGNSTIFNPTRIPEFGNLMPESERNKSMDQVR